MTWAMQIVCIRCGYIGAQTVLTASSEPSLEVMESCPVCTKREARRSGPSRYYIWREMRRLRRDMATFEQAPPADEPEPDETPDPTPTG